MFTEDELQKAQKHFAILGPQVSEADIDSIFPGSFPGKQDLVQFYLWNNGGSRTRQGCLIHCGNRAHHVLRSALETTQVEGFMSVTRDPQDRLLPFYPILKHHAHMLEMFSEIAEMKEFYEENVPFAFAHSGEDICINLKSGSVQYMDWANYREGAVEISPSFQDFVLNFWVHAEPAHSDES